MFVLGSEFIFWGATSELIYTFQCPCDNIDCRNTIGIDETCGLICVCVSVRAKLILFCVIDRTGRTEIGWLLWSILMTAYLLKDGKWITTLTHLYATFSTYTDCGELLQHVSRGYY